MIRLPSMRSIAIIYMALPLYEIYHTKNIGYDYVSFMVVAKLIQFSALATVSHQVVWVVPEYNKRHDRTLLSPNANIRHLNK